MKYHFFILLFLLMLGSCKESPVPIPDFELPDTERVVLIEYLTGVKCPNCPKGSAALKNIESSFPGKIAIVGVHGRLQTEPLSVSKYDFRTDISNRLEALHNPFLGKPAALLNRIKFPDEPFVPVDFVDLWPSYIEEILRTEYSVNLLSDVRFDAASRKVDLNISMLPVENLEPGYRLSVFVTEGGIIDAQETIGSIIPDYVHDHVLRAMLSDVSGDPIVDALVKDQPLVKTYSYLLPANFSAEHIELIVAVSRPDGTIDQALKTKIVP